MRLDRLIGKWGCWGKRSVRERFEAGLIRLNGEVIEQANTLVGKFDRVEVGDEIVQAHVRRSLMMNKPSGVVSATVDDEHQTVIDLIEEEWAGELHLAGRLDRFTTGLIILTNDSQFSESLTEPRHKVGKRYLVNTDRDITSEMATAFREGMWFAKEKVTIAPAIVKIVDERKCWLTIYEGKHHQVKRMFARFEVKVMALHRESIGEFDLDGLAPGEWKTIRH